MQATEIAGRLISLNTDGRHDPVMAITRLGLVIIVPTNRKQTAGVPIMETEMRIAQARGLEPVKADAPEMTTTLPGGGNLRYPQVCGTMPAAKTATRAMAEDVRAEGLHHDLPVAGLTEDI